MEAAKPPARFWAPGLLGLLLGLMGGCAPGVHATALRPSAPPVYLAPRTCWDTVSCCVERNPFTALESCGADPVRAASILKTLAEAYAVLETPPESEATEASQTEAAAQPIPRWRQKCIMTYVQCVDKKWNAKCDDCLRTCVGQRKWPEDRCPSPKNQH